MRQHLKVPESDRHTVQYRRISLVLKITAEVFWDEMPFRSTANTQGFQKEKGRDGLTQCGNSYQLLFWVGVYEHSLQQWTWLDSLKYLKIKSWKKRNSFKTNTEAPNEIMDLVNDSKRLLKPLSEKLMEGKKLKNFVMDRSSRQQPNLLINLNIIKRKAMRNYVVLMWCNRNFMPPLKYSCQKIKSETKWFWNLPISKDRETC